MTEEMLNFLNNVIRNKSRNREKINIYKSTLNPVLSRKKNSENGSIYIVSMEATKLLLARKIIEKNGVMEGYSFFEFYDNLVVYISPIDFSYFRNFTRLPRPVKDCTYDVGYISGEHSPTMDEIKKYVFSELKIIKERKEIFENFLSMEDFMLQCEKYRRYIFEDLIENYLLEIGCGLIANRFFEAKSEDVVSISLKILNKKTILL
ncbi:hypothetical protein [Rhodospirillum sp. A1_3_36]|uniref:hypothetical protein n=1 Tax=Rhodospirillum sp. A1_3_36 TaxID=3391666 RepID=UPI0039A6F0E3